MIKPLIRFRKRFILPMFWRIKELQEIDGITVRSKQEIYDKIREVKEELHQARLNEKAEEIEVANAKLSIFKWLVK